MSGSVSASAIIAVDGGDDDDERGKFRTNKRAHSERMNQILELDRMKHKQALCACLF